MRGLIERLGRKGFTNKLSIRGRKRELSVLPRVEELEEKIVPSGGVVSPTDLSYQHQSAVTLPLASGSNPAGLSPAQVRGAYGISSIAFSSGGGSVAGDGTGETIAIVDAYDDPSIANDLAVFDQQYGLPAPASFTKVGLSSTGTASTTRFPSADSGWAGEIELDVEWAHAVAPRASIVLVEANSASINALLAGVDYARNYPGVVAVSMSWGTSEFSGQTQYDSHFTTPAGHVGVTFFASSGDNGPPPIWPSSSSHVVGVGGTTLNVSGSGAYLSESGWSSGGGGTSSYVTQPSYQSGLLVHDGLQTISTGGMRAIPDVSYDADPASGVAVYGSYGWGGWAQVGGTSAGAPQWAGLMAIVEQGRSLAGQASLDGYTQTLPKLYQLPSSDYHSITTGSNGYSAGPGYNLVTGLGSPVANLLVPALAGTSSTPPPTVATAAHVVSSTPTSVTLNALGADHAGANTLTYTWALTGTAPGTVSFSANGNNAAQTTTATFSQVGAYTFQVTITDPSNLSVTSSVAYTVNAVASSITVSPSNATVADGGTRQFSAAALDQFGNPLTGQPAFTWSIDAGGLGTISTGGLYSAPESGTGSATIRASSGTISGTASVNVAAIGGPSILTAATASSQSPTSVVLSVSATDSAGAMGLQYTWTVTGTPPAPVSFSANNSNAAQATTAKFGALGTYNFLVTVTDPSNLSVTSTVTVTVSATLSTISVTPSTVTLAAGATQQFSATASDQFGNALATQPALTWSVASGAGTISSSGLFTAGSASATVAASSGTVSGQAAVSVQSPSSTFTSITRGPIQPRTITYIYLNVNQDTTIGSLTAKLNVSYPYDSDLVIDLISPQGIDVTLSYFDGYGRNFQNTVFSDSASTPIYWGYSPFAGTYSPETPLGATAGFDMRGTWTLAVSNYGFSFGTITSWSITVQAATQARRADVGTRADNGSTPSGYVLVSMASQAALLATPPNTQGASAATQALYSQANGFSLPQAYANPSVTAPIVNNAFTAAPVSGTLAGQVAAGREASPTVQPGSGQAVPQATPVVPRSGDDDPGSETMKLHSGAVASASENPAFDFVFTNSVDEPGSLLSNGIDGLEMFARLAVILAGSWSSSLVSDRVRRELRARSPRPNDGSAE